MGAPDKNFLSFGSTVVGEQSLGNLVPPPEFAPWNDTLKFSNATDGHVIATLIQGGSEDAMDANNGSKNLFVHSDEWRSGGKNVFTIKGECQNISVSGTITKHGSVVDVDIDNYSDQKHGASYMIQLNLKTLDGSPVTYRSLKGCKPIILNPEQPYKEIFYLPWFLGMIWDRFYQFLKIIKVCK